MGTSVKLFLASSIVEFGDLRRAIGNLVRRAENRYWEKGCRIRLFVCEYASSAVALGGKQKEYNGEIDDTDVVIAIFGNRLGQFTLEELDYAKERQRQTGKPEILIFYKKPQEGDDAYQELTEYAKAIDTDVLEMPEDSQILQVIEQEIVKRLP